MTSTPAIQYLSSLRGKDKQLKFADGKLSVVAVPQ